MTSRDRKASGCLTTTATADPVPIAAGSLSVPANGRHGADNGASRVVCWEEWFQHASPAQCSEMLALAKRQQGLLYAHQLAAAANGMKTRPAAGPVPSPVLERLLAGQVDESSPLGVALLTFLDPDLDACQREAVARAMATPDVFLLQGYPGTGRSRVLAEIIHQSAQRGERVLYLANEPASLNAVLLRLEGDSQVLALRHVQPGEDALPADLLPCTLSERQRSWQQQLKDKSAEARAHAHMQCQARQAEESCWAPLRDLAGRLEENSLGLRENAEKLNRLPDEVKDEAGAGTGRLRDCTQQLEQQYQQRRTAAEGKLSQKQQEHAAAAAALAESQRHVSAWQSLAEIKQRGRWWTSAWWRAALRGNVRSRLAALENRHQELQAALEASTNGVREMEDHCRRLREQFDNDLAQLLQEECDCRRRQHLEKARACEAEHQRLLAAWLKQLESLDAPDHRPLEPTLEAVSAAQKAWERQRRLDEEACAFACRWADYQTEGIADLASRVSAWANVVAGTMGLLKQDAIVAAAPFDLLVLDNAEQFTETDLRQAAAWAGRWVLVAQTHELQEGQAEPGHEADGRPAVPALPRLECFQKLWRSLHCDSRRLHYAWSHEKDRLCCSLRPVAKQDHAQLEIEHVADFPEIELRILAKPRVSPVLAQVVFPAHFSIIEAKAFIYRELEEVAVQCCGRGAWLSEEPGRLEYHLHPYPGGATLSLELENGLREYLTADDANTVRLEFDRAAGWDRPKVDHWLQKHLQLRDLGRTMALQVPYRWSPGLAGAINSIAFGGALALMPNPAPADVIEFIPVPPLAKAARHEDKRRHSPGTNGHNGLPREGAGLEQDLTTFRLADRLPSDLRSQLPRNGFANYLEAQAVIRRLEDLFRQPPEGPVAVIALFEGQVELLRCLAGRSDLLRRAPGLVIGLPALFQEREWPTVLVSLTRSHGHRAVPLSERPEDLVLALTRARKQLIVFADLGTLVKRSHWQGPLDHLDAAAADLEGKRITALVRWLSKGS
jgi:hypothetical protein